MDFYTRGIQAFEQGRQRAVRNRLAELTSGYLAAPQDQRGDFAAQFAAVDPETGMGIATRERERGMERLRAQATFLASASPEVQQRLYGAMRPQLAQIGINAPEQFDPSLVEPIRSAAFGLGGSGARVQSRFVGEDGQVYAMMSNSPVPVPTGVRAENLLTPETLTQNGIEVSGLIDRRAGEFRGFGAGQTPPAAPQPGGGMSIPVPGGQIDVADPAAAEFLRNNPSVMQGLSSGRPFDFPASAPARGGFITNDPAAQAAATAAAQTQARIGAENALASDTARAQGEIEAGKIRGKTQAERELELPRLRRLADRNIADGARKVGMINSLIAEEINPNISGWTTGTFANFLSSVGGTGAANLEASLDTLRAFGAFSELQAMRDSSPTGGALGSVTERELSLLEAAFADVRQSRSPEAFRRAVQRYQIQVQTSWDNVLNAYEDQFGERPSAPTTPTMPQGNQQSPAGFRIISTTPAGR